MNKGSFNKAFEKGLCTVLFFKLLGSRLKVTHSGNAHEDKTCPDKAQDLEGPRHPAVYFCTEVWLLNAFRHLLHHRCFILGIH
jgi:hypothetical protein